MTIDEEVLRKQDTSLHAAIEQEELELPPMPTDLNARLMQRVEEEKAKKVLKRKRIFWPLVAAACVAGLITIFLTPPKNPNDAIGETPTIAQVNHPTKKEDVKTETPPTYPISSEKVKAETEQQVARQETAEQPQRHIAAQPLLAQEKMRQETTTAETTMETTHREEVAPEPSHTQMASVTLNERDIPITRPENLKYTPEEIAQLKRQANEAYLKWVELELEITKYTMEHTAQK